MAVSALSYYTVAHKKTTT